MSTENCVRAAVIGESASGKSEFIRSFSNHPELIDSVGEGQTTRSYAEYDFVVTQEDKPLVASIWLLNEQEFVKRRVEQAYAQLLKLDEYEEVSLSWVTTQIREYRDDINNIFLYSTDFFDIREFAFLSETLVPKILSTFESMCDYIKLAQENSISIQPPSWISNINKKISHFEEHLDYSLEDGQEDPDSQEAKFMETTYENFFIFVYRNICSAMEDYLREKFGQALCETDASLFFNIMADNKDILALFLRVVKYGDKSRRSLSGLVSKIKISGTISLAYYEEIKDFGIYSVLLVDTYGLDHDQSPDTNHLENRYQKIFNNDYPDLAAVLFVKKIQSSADTTFSNELKSLYTVKPNLMTYIVGTHIDKQNSSLLKSKQDWLLSKGKDSDYPAFNGKVMELIYDNTTVANVLRRNNVPESLAKNRLEVMRSRFAPFCGKINSLTDNELSCIMKKMNISSVSSLIASIYDREHLGSGYINIDVLCAQLENTDFLLPFAQKFIENVTQQFQNLYSSAGPRTRWRVRINFEDKKVLGYNGSMTDATWYRAFNDAYNLTFTKRIMIDTKYVTLSDKYNLQGNEKLAFDELMTSFFPIAFRRACQPEELLSLWQHELNCSRYPQCCEQSTCMWGMLLDYFYTSDFQKYNRPKHGRVVDWLSVNHDFSRKCDDEFYFNWARLFLRRMNDDFIGLCRNHNLKIAATKVKRSKEGFIETKETLYQEYNNLDSRIDRPSFFHRINAL